MSSKTQDFHFLLVMYVSQMRQIYTMHWSEHIADCIDWRAWYIKIDQVSGIASKGSTYRLFRKHYWQMELTIHMPPMSTKEKTYHPYTTHVKQKGTYHPYATHVKQKGTYHPYATHVNQKGILPSICYPCQPKRELTIHMPPMSTKKGTYHPYATHVNQKGNVQSYTTHGNQRENVPSIYCPWQPKRELTLQYTTYVNLKGTS